MASDLTSRDWKLLLLSAECVTYHRDVPVVEEGVKNRRLFRIKAGVARVEKHVGGEETTLNHLEVSSSSFCSLPLCFNPQHTHTHTHTHTMNTLKSTHTHTHTHTHSLSLSLSFITRHTHTYTHTHTLSLSLPLPLFSPFLGCFPLWVFVLSVSLSHPLSLFLSLHVLRYDVSCLHEYR